MILAYIDPGSGSALLSLIMGALVAMALGVDTYWQKLKSMFRRTPKPEPEPEAEAEEAKTD